MQEYPSSSMFSSNPPDAETWKAYWKEQGQPWRTEPIIDEERQQRLLSYSRGGVDIGRGRYPFKGVRLSRGYRMASGDGRAEECEGAYG